jgi:hypothetical protein
MLDSVCVGRRECRFAAFGVHCQLSEQRAFLRDHALAVHEYFIDVFEQNATANIDWMIRVLSLCEDLRHG